MASEMNPGPDEVCRWRQRVHATGRQQAGGWHPTHHSTSPMTTPAPWITNRPPSHSDADPRQYVLVPTSIDMHSDQCTVMHWSLAAKGYLPWRHTSRWVSPEPEPPAPVIVTPEEEPEAVAPEISHWITDRLPTKVDADKDGDVEISTSSGLAVDWSYEKWYHVTLGWAWRHCSTWLPPELEPSTPAAPEPEARKATRGFLEFVRLPYSTGFLDSAVGTDNTAWVRYRVGNSDDNIWIKVLPLPQPGEE